MLGFIANEVRNELMRVNRRFTLVELRMWVWTSEVMTSESQEI